VTPIQVRSEVVPIDSLKAYPLNPRRGNLKAIQESLKINGQYRPIVVQQSTSFILAGNHTWQAAKSLGWTEIAVSFVECDEKAAKKIVLADNRTSDLGLFNDELILELLEELDSWDGTGYNLDDFDKMDGLYEAPLPNLKDEKDEDKPSVAPPASSETEHLVRIGLYVIEADEDELNSLSKGLRELSKDKKGQIEHLKERLGFKEQVVKGNLLEPHHVIMGGTEVVPITNVRPHPRNPREGDVGAISESLKTLGQYRPIIVNKNDLTILIGNHTWHAAYSLGWKEIAVTWIEVDDEQAIRILLSDNKTADLATYDDEELQILLASLTEFSGTGFDGDDVDSILRGSEGTPIPKTVKGQVGTLTFKVSRSEFQIWQDELPLNHDEACKVIAERLLLTNWKVRKVNQ
jgi:ParB-like chromosome segregation protein Spo0J